MKRQHPEDALQAQVTGRIYALGVDPGATSGWALVSLGTSGRPRLDLHGAARHLPYRDVITDLIIRVGILEPVTCQIESQFVPGDAAHRAQAVDSLATAASRGAWEEACSAAGWRVLQPVSPNVWRKAVLGGWEQKWTRAACKAAAIRQVALLDRVKVADHVAEAILMAGYAAELVRYQERCGVTVSETRRTR